MPVFKRVVEIFEVVYDHDCKIEVDYNDLVLNCFQRQENK